MEIVLDTDTASHLFRDTLPSVAQSRLRGHDLFITFVTLAEMLRGAKKARWGIQKVTQLETWLGRWPVMAGEEECAREWARIVAELEDKGRSMGANDAWVAACCLAADFPLATLNQKHFKEVPAYG
ncbi:MAG: PIN domain-containing protein [Actinomycetota bacterium]